MAYDPDSPIVSPKPEADRISLPSSLTQKASWRHINEQCKAQNQCVSKPAFESKSDEVGTIIPLELMGERVVSTAIAAALLGYSEIHLRRLAKRKMIPSPIRIGERKLGWRVAHLLAFLDSKGVAP